MTPLRAIKRFLFSLLFKREEMFYLEDIMGDIMAKKSDKQTMGETIKDSLVEEIEKEDLSNLPKLKNILKKIVLVR